MPLNSTQITILRETLSDVIGICLEGCSPKCLAKVTAPCTLTQEEAPTILKAYPELVVGVQEQIINIPTEVSVRILLNFL